MYTTGSDGETDPLATVEEAERPHADIANRPASPRENTVVRRSPARAVELSRASTGGRARARARAVFVYRTPSVARASPRRACVHTCVHIVAKQTFIRRTSWETLGRDSRRVLDPHGRIIRADTRPRRSRLSPALSERRNPRSPGVRGSPCARTSAGARTSSTWRGEKTLRSACTNSGIR